MFRFNRTRITVTETHNTTFEIIDAYLMFKPTETSGTKLYKHTFYLQADSTKKYIFFVDSLNIKVV